MSYEQKDNTGALFHQKEKKSDAAPDYSGECLINGVRMEIAGWRKTSAKGTAYMSLKFQVPGSYKKAVPEGAPKKIELEDDIPF